MRRWGWGLGPWRVAVAVLCEAASTGVRAQPAEPAAMTPALMIVFDGSGSMWGPIEGTRQSKLVVARESMRRALTRIAPQTRVGLTSFGNRRGDCSDVEVVRRAEPIDMERIMLPLERLNPRGRGPLTLALREAAKALPGDGSRRTLVLIHDDADNCQTDLCPLATELRAAGVRAHVISLGPKPEDLAKMTCLPETTGGRLFYAQNAEQVEAAIEDALRLASNSTGPATEISKLPPSSRSAPSAAPFPVANETRPGLYLRTLLAEGHEPVAWPLDWTVTRAGQAGQPVFAARAANPSVALAPGQYRVEARDGAMAVTQEVEVGDKGPTVADIVLNAGTLRVRAQWQKSGAAIGDGVISIADAGQATPGGKSEARVGALLTSFRGSETTVMLPAGRYVVFVEEGLVRAQRSIVVPAGSRGRVDMSLNGARLRVTAVIRDGLGELDAPVFSIAEDDPDAPGGRREIAQSAAREAEFVVPPGTYHVSVRQGGLEGREVLAVGPGDVVRRTLSLAAGKLVLESRLAGAQVRAGGSLILPHRAARQPRTSGRHHQPAGARAAAGQRPLSCGGALCGHECAQCAGDRTQSRPDIGAELGFCCSQRAPAAGRRRSAERAVLDDPRGGWGWAHGVGDRPSRSRRRPCRRGATWCKRRHRTSTIGGWSSSGPVKRG